MVMLQLALGQFSDRWNPLNLVLQSQKKPGPDRPVISVIQESIGEIEIGKGRDCRSSCLDRVFDIFLDKSAVYRVLTDVFGPRNMCSVWIPHKLSDQTKVQ